MTDEEFLKEKENMKVEWRQLIYKGELQNYDISNVGQIRAHDTQKLLKLSKTNGMKNTYEFINIKLNNGKRVNTGIHRLVGIMFIPIPTKYITMNLKISDLDVDHIDSIRYHNIVSNLQWLTKQENITKAFNDINAQSNKLSDDTVKKICKDLCKNKTIYDISVKYKCSEDVIYKIRYGYSYKHISEKFTFPYCHTSEEKVIEVCELLMKNKTFTEIVDLTGVSISTIGKISAKKSWKYITEKYDFPNRRVMTPEKRNLIVRICEMLSEGKQPNTIAKELDISKSFVQHIAKRETHNDISKDYTFNYCKFKIDDDTVHKICADLESKQFSTMEISERNDVSKTFVKDIRRRKHRTDISKDYEW